MNKLRIAKDGSVSGIYSDDTLPILQKLGGVSITRASHVEPGHALSSDAIAKLPAELRPRGQIRTDLEQKWFADMAPVGGPVLGPYDSRSEALRQEVLWLKKFHFGFKNDNA